MGAVKRKMKRWFRQVRPGGWIGDSVEQVWKALSGACSIRGQCGYDNSLSEGLFCPKQIMEKELT